MCLVLTKIDTDFIVEEPIFISFPSTLSVSIFEQLTGISTVLGSGEQMRPLREPAPRPVLTGRGRDTLQCRCGEHSENNKNHPGFGNNLWWDKKEYRENKTVMVLPKI